MKKTIVTVLVLGAVVAVVLLLTRAGKDGNDFTRLMTVGGGYLTRADATNAVAAYTKAAQLAPESVDVWLNLANAHLLGGDSARAIADAKRALALDPNSGAAYYLQGLASVRLNLSEQAVQAFQQAQRIDPTISALNFQLGLAYERLNQVDQAIQEFETILQFEPDHPSAHYQLGRLYQRAGRADDATKEFAAHQAILAKNPNPPSGSTAYEKCKYTEPRVPFVLEQPDRQSVPLKFENATAAAFGPASGAYHAPVGVIDYNHDGRNSLFVLEGFNFRLLNNSNAVFTPIGNPVPAGTETNYSQCLVGDLNADRFEDIIVLGEKVSHAFRFATNGQFREVTDAAGLRNLRARKGVLADLDFTGRLNLLAIAPNGEGLRVFRNLGNYYFLDGSTNSGLPLVFPGTTDATVEDLNNEDVPGVLVARAGQTPVFFSKQRAGAFVQTNIAAQWPPGALVATGDLNNDLLLDVVVGGEQELKLVFGGPSSVLSLSLGGLKLKGLELIDYDNDGWLDLVAYGSGLRIWRNLGKAGFEDVTSALGFDKTPAVDQIACADFDQDGDTDLVLTGPTGLSYWRNQGGNANHQLKLRLVGNRSNPSGLGARVELASGHWRAIRTVQRLPFEMGVGKHEHIEVLKTRWFDLGTALMDLQVTTSPLVLDELVMPSGSCPYLYAWDGNGFRFVTDILGAAPMGLPVAEGRFVDADPEEFLALGDDRRFPPREGRYELRLTEELREVLYLDTARLYVVDHPAGTLVHPTSKMLPGKPFIPHELWTLKPIAKLQRATRDDGLDVTAAMSGEDRSMAGPVKIREPQLRGLAEPFSIEMDFGPLPVSEPLVLVLNGWLRFGGGMANIAGSIDPTLPFPFPKLEVQSADGTWKLVDAVVGVPAGKTKTILVDLTGKLAPGAHRLRLSAAYEMYWDCVSICAKTDATSNRLHILEAASADLHWRGFAEFADLPPSLPLTPVYDKVHDTPPWRRTPEGWCTRYGPVGELLSAKDNSLVLLNGGDEVALSFDAKSLPSKPDGFVRDFFLYAVGWDKDADFHVGQGWRVEPLPFHGMDDQAYGHQARPHGLNDEWIGKYNTRWVGSLVLGKK